MGMYDGIKAVYGALADGESKAIFCRMLMYSLTGDWQYFKKILLMHRGKRKDGYRNLPDILYDPGILGGRDVVLFGAGVWGWALHECLCRSGIEVRCFCDNDTGRVGTKYYGKEIISAADLVEKHRESVVVVATEKFETQILRQLEQLQFPAEQIFGFHITDREIYFDREIMTPQAREIFIDAGCCDGETVLDFIKWSGDAAAGVYAFEPDEKNYQTCAENLGKYCKVPWRLEKAGLWNVSTKLGFHGVHGSGSRLEEGGESAVCVVTLDEALEPGIPVTFIKMDVEGAELEALKGAESTIVRWEPKLAVCLYHKPQDVWEIPSYVHELLPNHRLYIRHYSPYCLDTVLYAVPPKG